VKIFTVQIVVIDTVTIVVIDMIDTVVTAPYVVVTTVGTARTTAEAAFDCAAHFVCATTRTDHDGVTGGVAGSHDAA